MIPNMLQTALSYWQQQSPPVLMKRKHKNGIAVYNYDGAATLYIDDAMLSAVSLRIFHQSFCFWFSHQVHMQC